MAFRVGNREDAERALQKFVGTLVVFIGIFLLQHLLSPWLGINALSFFVAGGLSGAIAMGLNSGMIYCLHALWPPKTGPVRLKSKAPKRRRPKPLQEIRNDE